MVIQIGELTLWFAPMAALLPEKYSDSMRYLVVELMPVTTSAIAATAAISINAKKLPLRFIPYS